jgi:hypothetical protein
MRDWQRTLLNLLKPWLMEPGATVIIPFDDRVIFVRLFHCAYFSRRLAEVPQTLDAISWLQFLARDRGIDERRSPGTVCVRDRPRI